ncbi:2-phospho-L-lactate guanylyltransferase [Nocardioides sp. GY 10113]|uniref:2-phospho-L-lactate guanylyltransferase n=1 Tax=Nocardioides sp. GY 10113 TaxID=2569761 RepID=UPI001F1016F6|nr:2-phospho-L-lactate guanylyltransferase [Nocardioides sp. GY 10113]
MSAFVLLVPVKSPGAGKSRLVGVPDRPGLAAALAIDTVQSALAADLVARVLVTTDDEAFAATLRDLGAATTRDPGGGLNAALREAAAEAARRWPDLRPAALLADLPALRPEDLDQALASIAAAGAGSHFVADADGTGTVLYAAPRASFLPRFGVGSARAHEDAGARPVRGLLASLRRDVDDLPSLEDAVGLGVGPRTRAALAASPGSEA